MPSTSEPTPKTGIKGPTRADFLRQLRVKNSLNVRGEASQAGFAGASAQASTVAPAPATEVPSPPPASPPLKRTRHDGPSNSASKAPVTASIPATFLGWGGITLPVPDESNPKCQKLKGEARYVPSPALSFPKRSAGLKFASPLYYGACMAEREVVGELSSEDALDLVSQKLGEALRLSQLLRDKAFAEGKEQQRLESAALLDPLRKEMLEAQTSRDAAVASRDEAQAALAKVRAETDAARMEEARSSQRVIELSAEVDSMCSTIEDLKKHLEESQAQVRQMAEEEASNSDELYRSSVVLACKKARDLYPESSIDWESLLELSLEEMQHYASL